MAETDELDALGTLAGGVALEVNNVLAVIQAIAETSLFQLEEGSPQRAGLQTIVDASLRGAEVTHNLLAFAGRGTTRHERFEVAGLLEALAAVFRQDHSPDVELVCDASQQAQVHGLGDSEQMLRALMNVCDNSVRALRGRGQIHVGLHQEVLAKANLFGIAAGPYTVIEIRDHGEGMDVETQSRAFEPFYSGPATRGTIGLGLSMVYGTMIHHGGGVQLQSMPGEGTSVRLALPAVAQDLDRP